MILSKLSYYENKDKDNYWEIKDLCFNKINLIIGLNATGKTRLVRVISGFAKIVSRKSKFLNGNWNLEFVNNEIKYQYILQINKGLVKTEKIKVDNRIVLKRSNENGEIYSEISGKKQKINPPNNALVLHIRRDIKEYSFFEEFISWAENFIGYNFTSVRPNNISIPIDPDNIELFDDLGATPYILKKMLVNKQDIKSIKQYLEDINYPVDDINVKSLMQANLSREVLLTKIKERDLKCEIDQTQMSQGMFRAIALIIILQQLIRANRSCTVVIDDIGEGLDYERSTKLIKLLVNKIAKSKIQLIVTSNHRFMINAVELKYLNILERKGQIVKSFNYRNSKKLFDDFKYTGLNNFDLFTGKMYDNGK